MSTRELRWRKFSPVDRAHPILELLEGDVILLDLTLADSGDIELTFHDGACRRTLDLVGLEAAIAAGKKLLLEEIGSA